MDTLKSLDEFKDYIGLLRPVELEKFINELFISRGSFLRVEFNPVINNRQIDITLVEKNRGAISEGATWAVEIKSYRSLVSINVIDAFYGKLLDLQEVNPKINLLLIATSGYTKASIAKSQKLGISLWGPKELYGLYTKSKIVLSASIPPESAADESIETKVNAFKEVLNGIEAGEKHWSKYQSLVVDILEFLLCPPLGSPEVELADKDKRNRRDIIFENSANDGFWKIVRDNYEGHYVVVDAKNYAKPLTKRPILDISHYLKVYGCGLFSIIVSRKGYSPSGDHAAKEQWIGSHKMIVSLSDEDIVKMLELKQEGLNPEDVIKGYISKFRMLL